MAQRKIAVVTTSRAEYGLLYWTLKRLQRDRGVKLQLIVSGSHLSGVFGRTARAIEADGLPIAARIPVLAADDKPVSAARALGRGVTAFADVLERLKPEWLVVLGDRYELLAPCAAAVALRLPIAHIHGGEATEGVLDEQVRHAITKMAHLHLTAAEPYRKKVLRMGEPPARVINCGAPGLEALAKLKRLSRAELEKRLNFSLAGPLALVTYHPTSPETALSEANAMLSALKNEHLFGVITYANADAGGRAVNARLRAFAKKNSDRFIAVPSLGQQGYLSLMALCDVVVGNSSSGILEAPSLKAPTVNIGERQAGRLRAPSVIDCAAKRTAIEAALRRALSPAFRAKNCRGSSPYGGGPVSARIVSALKSARLGPEPARKRWL